MVDILCVTNSRLTSWPTRGLLHHLRHFAIAAALVIAPGFTAAHASVIFGTLSNFDIYNATPEPSEGAEIELEGVHSSSVRGSFPSHYDNKTVAEYNDASGSFAGTRITYSGYNFNAAVNNGSLNPVTSPVNTNGHTCVNTEGCEHFGFWLNGAQPTATRFFWLNDDNGTFVRIGTTPETVPGPNWIGIPAGNGNGGNAMPVVQAVLRVPEPVEPPNDPNLRPDSTWVKVFKVKLTTAPQNEAEMQALLMDLMSGNAMVPEDGTEIETEWELLEGGRNPKDKVDEDQIDEQNDKTIIRRYEFFEYAGVYDAEHEAVDPLLDTFGTIDGLDPNMIPDGMGGFGDLVGDFIAANMAAAVLNPIPEPSSISLFLIGIGMMTVRRRSRS